GTMGCSSLEQSGKPESLARRRVRRQYNDRKTAGKTVSGRQTASTPACPKKDLHHETGCEAQHDRSVQVECRYTCDVEVSEMNRARLQPMQNRREFLWHASGCLASAAALSPWGEPGVASLPAARPKVAAIFTEFTYRSHAHVILENFLEPYLF